MSLRYALLGLLANEPSSGYDLNKVFEGDFGRYAWHARHTQIYPELNRLADEGLVEVAEEGARGRRSYAITDAGLEALRNWLRNPPDHSKIRNEYVLRMSLLPALGQAEMREIMLAQAEYADRQTKQIRAAADQLDRETPPDAPMPFGRIAAEFGIRMNEASRDWSQWVIDHLR